MSGDARLEHLEAVEAAADRLVSVMVGYYPRPVQDALVELARLTGHLTPTPHDPTTTTKEP